MMSFLFVSSISHASVSLQTGAWVWNMNIQGIELNYNSRSLHQGWWGQGWCSDLDARLIKEDNGNIKFEHCAQTTSAPKIRSYENTLEVTYDDKIFVFNHRGLLSSVEAPTAKIKMEYSGDKIAKIKVNGTDLKVKTKDHPAKIAEIQAPFGSMTFHYSRDLLTEINTGSENGMSFKYDGFDNMTLIEKTAKGLKRHLASISYSADDRVSEVRTPSMCKSLYSYEEQKSGNEVVLLSKVQRQCPGFEESAQTKVLSSQFKLSKGNHLELVAVKEAYL